MGARVVVRKRTPRVDIVGPAHRFRSRTARSDERSVRHRAASVVRQVISLRHSEAEIGWRRLPFRYVAYQTTAARTTPSSAVKKRSRPPRLSTIVVVYIGDSRNGAIAREELFPIAATGLPARSCPGVLAYRLITTAPAAAPERRSFRSTAAAQPRTAEFQRVVDAR